MVTLSHLFSSSPGFTHMHLTADADKTMQAARASPGFTPYINLQHGTEHSIPSGSVPMNSVPSTNM